MDIICFWSPLVDLWPVALSRRSTFDMQLYLLSALELNLLLQHMWSCSNCIRGTLFNFLQVVTRDVAESQKWLLVKTVV